MNIEKYIAGRMNLSAAGRGSSVITRIATISVAIGIAVMVISIAVIVGFKEQITAILSGFGSHIQIVNFEGGNTFESSPISKDQPFLDELRAQREITSISPYAIKGGVTRSESDIQGVVLKGVDSEYDWGFFESRLIAGTLPRIEDTLRTKDVIISESLSNILQVGVDDPLDMMFIETPPRRDRFKISGIYSGGVAEMDNMLVMTDMRNVQRLNRWEEHQVTGFEITISDIDIIDRVDEQVEHIIYGSTAINGSSEPLSLNDPTPVSMPRYIITDNLTVESIKDRNPMIFDWLKTHNLNAIVIIVIMLAVSLLGMISAILIIILERVQMIGILKTLGMNNRSIQRLFIRRSSTIALKGLVIGNLIAIALCAVQSLTGVIHLDPSGYFIDVVPISLSVVWILPLNIAIFASIVVVLTLPTLIISLISPEKSIRYE